MNNVRNGTPAPSFFSADRPGRVVAMTLAVAAVLAGFGVAYLLCDVLFLMFIGIVLATAIRPAVDFLQRRGLPAAVAVATAYLGLIVFTVAILAAAAPYLFSQVEGLVRELPRAVTAMQGWLDRAGDAFWARVARATMSEFSTAHTSAAPEQAIASVGQTGYYLLLVLRGLLVAGVVLLLAFYWSLQSDRTVRWLLLLLPAERRKEARETVDEIEAKVGAYLRGQGLVCLAMALMAAVVYSLLGVQYAVVLGLLAGVMEVVPVLGPVLGALPPLGVAMVTSPGKTLWVLAAAVIMQQVEGYLLVPRIMDRSVGVHPMATLLAIAAFGAVLGVPGAILAIPLAAVTQVLLARHVLQAVGVPQQPSGRDAWSVLHYDIQQLLGDIRQRDKEGPSAEDIGPLGEAIEAIARDLEQSLPDSDNKPTDQEKAS